MATFLVTFYDKGKCDITDIVVDGAKKYRSTLHAELADAYGQIDRLEKLCRANGVDPTDPNGMPF